MKIKKNIGFGLFFISIGSCIGILGLVAVNKVGFDNQGPVPLSAVLYTAAAPIIIGLLFILFGDPQSDKKTEN